MKHFFSEVLLLVVIYALRSVDVSEVEERCSPCNCFTASFAPYYQKNMSMADCSWLDIADLGRIRLPSDIEYLDASNNKLALFPRQVLLNLTKLKFLILRGNPIACSCGVSTDSDDLKGLLYVDVTINNTAACCLSLFSKVKTIKMETDDLSGSTFSDAGTTEELHLATSAANLPEDLFRPLQSIHTIILNVTHCTSLPDKLFLSGMITRTLKTLVLSGPRLEIKDRNLLMNLTTLKSVHLILGGTQDLPYDVFYEKEQHCNGCNTQNRYYLKEVIIERVRRLPERLFLYLPQLSRVQIIDSKYIPSDLLQYSGDLESFALNRCGLQSMPDNFFNDTCIKHVDLSYNRLRFNGSEFAKVFGLKYLDLSHNAIERLSSQLLEGLKSSLRYLNLLDNDICDISQDAFSGFASLEELRIDLKCLTNIEATLLSDLRNLTKATIEVGDVKVMPRGAFASLASLRDLRLNDLQIIGLDEQELEKIIANSTLVHNTPSSSEVAFTPPENKLTYVLIRAGGGHCRGQDGNYRLTILNNRRQSGLKTYCTSKSHFHFEVPIKNVEANEANTAQLSTRKTSRRLKVNESPGEPRNPVSKHNTKSIPFRTLPGIAVLANIQSSVGPRPTQLPTTATVIKAKQPNPWRTIRPVKGLFRPTVSATPHAITTSTTTTTTTNNNNNTTARKNTGQTTSNLRKPSDENHSISTIKWAIPLGIGLLIVLIIGAVGWIFFQAKTQKERKRMPSNFGLIDTSYRALGPFGNPDVKVASAEGRPSGVPRQSAFDRSEASRASRRPSSTQLTNGCSTDQRRPTAGEPADFRYASGVGTPERMYATGNTAYPHFIPRPSIRR